MSLKPFQYQIGATVFGKDTQIPVSKVDVNTYNVNAQDFQVIRTDEVRFGIDTLAPGPIVFTMAVLDNYELESMASFSKNQFPQSIIDGRGLLLPQLALEWKGNDVRSFWGATKPLLFCDGDGVTRRIYGRPGKFTYGRGTEQGVWFDVQAEFRRADTYAHNDIEFYVTVPGTATRLNGDASSWIRILINGPSTDPSVTFGTVTVQLTGVTIAAGKSLEISSYPWSRRIIDSDGINWRAKLTGSTPYLDQLIFPANTSYNVSFTGGGTCSFLWREAYNVC